MPRVGAQITLLSGLFAGNARPERAVVVRRTNWMVWWKSDESSFSGTLRRTEDDHRWVHGWHGEGPAAFRAQYALLAD